MGHGHCNGSNVPPKHSDVEKHAMQNQRGVMFVASTKNINGRVARMRIRSAEKAEYQMADERDINAAHVLVQLANCVSYEMADCVSYFPQNDSQSFRRRPSVFQMSATQSLTTAFAKDNRKDGKMKATGEKLNFSLSKADYVQRKHKKRKVEKKYGTQSITEDEEEDGMYEMHELSDGCGLSSSWGKKSWQNYEAFVSDGHDGLDTGSLADKMTKQEKIKTDYRYLDGGNGYDYLQSRSNELNCEPSSMKKKSGLQQVDVVTVSLSCGEINDTLLSEDASVVKPAKSLKCPLITPTLHDGFSFSIIHLLSAVRVALLTPPCEHNGVANSEPAEENNLPSLNIHGITWCVRLKPGDPHILESKEPLPDLVRGVLKMFSSRIAPLGAKGWNPLTTYAKSTKRWSWIGPVSRNPSIDDCTKVETASAAWGLPHKMIVKLVDCFAICLKNDQEALTRIGCLPAPPVVLMQPANKEERFKYMRCQRSLTTINPSSNEVRTYFHMEEAVRYLVPDRAFSYTALDGKKSTVAPFSRYSGNPSAKARDHFMLRKDRPPHVTILSLVRDAAARLPGSIGTRADVCTLIRDSQYIVDDISDIQVNQVVSGALDRLHYELDPCLKFDKERHLWVYLHAEREEEDFESDGCTSSKRKCKWQGETVDNDAA